MRGLDKSVYFSERFPPVGDRIFEALAHLLRRRALRILGERLRMYSELMEELGVDSPTLAFHLRKLAGLVEKGGQRVLGRDGVKSELNQHTDLY